MNSTQELILQIRNGLRGTGGDSKTDPGLAWLHAIIYGYDYDTLVVLAARHEWDDGSAATLERLHATAIQIAMREDWPGWRDNWRKTFPHWAGDAIEPKAKP